MQVAVCPMGKVQKWESSSERLAAARCVKAAVLAIEGREVRVTNPDKPYFAREARLSKLDIVNYFLAVAPGALAGIRDRPIVLKRFVDGAEGEPFYQKRAPSG